MEIRGRELDDAQVIELLGLFPSSDSELERVKNAIKAEAQRNDKAVVVSFQSIERLTSRQLGALVAGLAVARIRVQLLVVPNERTGVSFKYAEASSTPLQPKRKRCLG